MRLAHYRHGLASLHHAWSFSDILWLLLGSSIHTGGRHKALFTASRANRCRQWSLIARLSWRSATTSHAGWIRLIFGCMGSCLGVRARPIVVIEHMGQDVLGVL